ncbi:hypothetical protein [Enterobacter hormaechei]
MAQGLFEGQEVSSYSGGVQPQQATAPAPSIASTITGSGALNAVGSLFDGLTQGIAAGQKAAKQAKDDRTMSGYAKKIAALDAGVAQGTLSQSAAQRQQRALYSQLITDNPHLTEKLTDFTKAIGSTKGLGDTLAEGTAVDQQIVADTKSATAQGFISPGMTPDEQEKGLNLYRQREQQMGEMKFYSQQLDIQKQKMSIVAQQESIAASRVQRANAAADLTLKKNKMYAQQAVADFANNAYQHTQTRLGDIGKQLAAGQINQEQALAATNMIKDEIMAQTMKMRGVAGGDYIDSLSKPIFDSIDARNKFLSGQITEDVLKTKLNTLESKSALPFMSDPEMARIITTSKYLGAVTNTDVLGSFGDYMSKFLKKNGSPTATPNNPLTDDPDEKEQTKVYTGSLIDVTNGLANKNPAIADPKGTFDELQTHVNQLLKGVGSFSGAHSNPKDYNEVVNYMADPAFLNYQKLGGRIDQSNLESVKNVISVNYMDKLVPTVQREWEQASSVVGFPQQVKQVGAIAMPVPNTQPADKTLRYVWSGNTIEFRPAKGYEDNRGVIAKAGDLQKKLAPVINKSVMMRAHLDGSSDYTKYFKMSEAEMFGVNTQDTSSVNGR